MILPVARIGFGDLVLEEPINQAEKCIEKGNGEGVTKIVRLLCWGFAGYMITRIWGFVSTSLLIYIFSTNTAEDMWAAKIMIV